LWLSSSLGPAQVKPGAFAGVLPFTIVGGYVAELRITIPWASLTSTPVQVWLKRVDMNVSFGNKSVGVRHRAGSDPESHPTAAAAAQNPFAIPQDTLQEDASGGGWTASIASKIVGNGSV
jgi:hypothetical protein